jgi:hypothetical protein
VHRPNGALEDIVGNSGELGDVFQTVWVCHKCSSKKPHHISIVIMVGVLVLSYGSSCRRGSWEATEEEDMCRTAHCVEPSLDVVIPYDLPLHTQTPTL